MLQYKFQGWHRKKLVLAVIAVLFSIVLLFLISSPTRPPKEERREVIIPTVIPTKKQIQPVTTIFTPEQLQAIEEQRQADEIVGIHEIEVKTNYPWFIKLPLTSEKYFVYFEPNSEVFTGLLYTTAWDNVDSIKDEIIKKLIDIYGVPVDKYPFEWKVNP